MIIVSRASNPTAYSSLIRSTKLGRETIIQPFNKIYMWYGWYDHDAVKYEWVCVDWIHLIAKRYHGDSLAFCAIAVLNDDISIRIDIGHRGILHTELILQLNSVR